MDVQVTQDEIGTHLDWSHDGITPRMIDWFWSNMEKGFVLWHPQEHEALTWRIPPTHGNHVGAVHIAPQTWSDGQRQNLYIRFEDISWVTPEARSVICYRHVVIAAGLGFGEESLEVEAPMGYRVHQWQATDAGVVGRSSAIPRTRPETAEMGLVWAKHCAEEVGNWGAFLPELYRLFRVVENPQWNPYTDLSVEGTGQDARYLYVG